MRGSKRQRPVGEGDVALAIRPGGRGGGDRTIRARNRAARPEQILLLEDRRLLSGTVVTLSGDGMTNNMPDSGTLRWAIDHGVNTAGSGTITTFAVSQDHTHVASADDHRPLQP